jgi:5-methylcytosine-specific restriction endonuclease McrA
MPIHPENKSTWRKLSPAARIGRTAPYGERSCDHCGKAFSPYRIASVYCGRNCQRRAETARARASIHCKRCSTPISAASAKAEYCGAQCKTADARQRINSDPVGIEKRRAAARRYSKSERYRFNQANLKAIRRTATRSGGLGLDEWRKIKRLFDDRCAYCGCRERLTMDHVRAISRGGRHDAKNIVPACQSCNSRKGASDWTDKICQYTKII